MPYGTTCGKKYHKYIYAVGITAVLIVIGSYWHIEFNVKPDQALRLQQSQLPQTQGVGSQSTPVTAMTPPLSSLQQPLTPQAQTVAATNLAGPQPLPANPFAIIIDFLMPSVVNVAASNQKPTPPPALPGQNAPTNNFSLRFAEPSAGVSLESIGSGVILDTLGHILTNFHVIENTKHVYVTVFNDQGSQRFPADVLQRDATVDLALLKIQADQPLRPAPIGNSDALRIGDPVIAIGSPFGLDQTVSKGIISGKRKSIEIGGVLHKGLLQTDSAINRGNSGGPLVNDRGYVIGINTAIYTSNNAFAGVGFAVPSNDAVEFLTETIQLPNISPPPLTTNNGGAGHIAARPPPPIQANAKPPHGDRGPCETCHEILPTNQPVAGFIYDTPQRLHIPGQGHKYGNQFSFAPGGAIGLSAAMATPNGNDPGLQLSPLDPVRAQALQSPYSEAIYVDGVLPGSAAQGAGVLAGDILFKLDGRRVTQPEDFGIALAALQPGEEMRMSVVRNGQRLNLYLKPSNGTLGQTVAAPVQQPMPIQGGIQPMPQGGMQPMPKPAATPPVQPAKTEFEWMGMELSPIDAAKAAKSPNLKGKQGGLVGEVDPGGIAERAGIQANDLIVAINGEAITGAGDLDKAIQSSIQLGSALIEVERNGQRLFTMLQ
ncbi:MAG: trypsin-like peptidase domain-containing protein [Magnetococcus sp. DMHC-6]